MKSDWPMFNRLSARNSQEAFQNKSLDILLKVFNEFISSVLFFKFGPHCNSAAVLHIIRHMFGQLNIPPLNISMK